jgi:hypothetical protein
MLTSIVVNDLVKKLNDQLDIPFVNEAKEGAALYWLVERVSQKVPYWVLGFMDSAADGLTRDEVAKHEDIIVDEINKVLDLPGTPEFIEEKLIRFVVKAILEYALVGMKAPGV